MLKPPIPSTEARRLAALHACQILDTPAEQEFDDLARLAAQLCGTPVASISFVGADRHWSKALIGLSVRECSRDLSFSAHVVSAGSFFVVPDTHLDERFADHPLVQSDPHVRFYAGAPLLDDAGDVVGALCVVDFVPRQLSSQQVAGLETLARQVMAQIQLRANSRKTTLANVERQQSRHALRSTFERLKRQNDELVNLAMNGLSAGVDTPSAAAAVTEAGARTMGVRRASVWLYDEHWTLIRCLDLYEVGTAAHTAGLELRREQFPAYFSAMDDEETIAAHVARSDSRTREFTVGYLDVHGITSMLDTPIRVGGRSVGVLCFEHVGPPRKWRVDEETFAASLATLFAVCLESAERRRSEERYRLVNRATNDVIWDWDFATGNLFWNEAIHTTLGHSPDVLLPTIQYWIDHVHPEDRQRVHESIHAIIDSKNEYWADQYRFRRGDGSYAQVFDRGYVSRDCNGRAIRMIGAMQDVTERCRAEDRLREQTQISEVLYRVGQTVAAELDLQTAVQTVTSESVKVTRAQYGAFLYNPADVGAVAYQAFAVAGLPRNALDRCPLSRIAQVLDRTFRSKQIVRMDDVTHSPSYGSAGSKNADELTIRSYLAAPVISRSGRVLGVLFFGHEQAGLFRERDECLITGIAAQAAIAIDNARLFDDARRLGERMAYQALHDPLTGLPNRAYFNDRVACCVQRARRDSNYHYAVLFLDLDRFKLVNDSLGHAAGDRLLTEIATRLPACIRESDTLAVAEEALAQIETGDISVVARLGGDEFTILLDGLTHPTDAARVAERVLAAVCQPVIFDGHEVATTGSIGIVVGGSGYASEKEVLRDADAAMYKAKETGKNRYAIFDEMLHSAAVSRLRLENDLRRAVERGELLLHYQPIVSLQTRELIGFEALVRWKRDGRLISPVEFIPVAEDIGLIVPIGAWVMTEACQQLAAWRLQFPKLESLSLSVNLSRRQLGDAGLVPLLTRVLKATAVNPASIKLEITESVIMDDPGSAREVLTAVKATGVRLSMDDFGTGYSSLSCLHRFPLDELKVDRSFIANLEGRRDAAAVVNAVIGLAHNMGLKVVAEGLEKLEHAAFLQAVDCDYGQGFLFSRPLDALAATATLVQAERQQRAA